MRCPALAFFRGFDVVARRAFNQLGAPALSDRPSAPLAQRLLAAMSEHACAPTVRDMVKIANVSGKLVSGFESIIEFLDLNVNSWKHPGKNSNVGPKTQAKHF